MTTEDVSATRTAIGISGPQAAPLLEGLGASLPRSETGRWWIEIQLFGIAVELAGGGAAVPTFQIWCAAGDALPLWQGLLAAGAVPCGAAAVDALRVLSGTPLYGVDIHDRDLPQETGQMQALHFAKGCYLGQEIVERIRSRGSVHRRLAVLALSAEPAALPCDLTGGEQAAGRITSVALFQGTLYGLGLIRADAAERHGTLNFLHGTATVLPQPPLARM